MLKKNLIIGTAGHIDHGKTTLIKALTGHDTDRLGEEKERGISIELGFTDLQFDDGMQLGIIDVPGHEKFIKNMLAGAGGVDMALLVVAADEGVMAQTREHLAILDLLNVKKGLVAITKIDQVENEWLELVIEDTREKLGGTFLEGKPIVPVSSLEKDGIDRLKDEIKKMALSISDKDPADNIYYPIDRVFTLSGHGTVVTGTLVSGKISTEDKLMVYPQKLDVRVRSLQVHNSSADEVYPGQRVGINLAGIDKDEVNRGDVLATSKSLVVTDFIDGRLNLLEDCPMVVEHGDRIRFHIGAREVLGRVYMIEKEQLLPGEDGLVQFRLEEEIVARYKENFVIRRYSPMTTIGGGVVLDNNPPYRKKLEMVSVEELEIKENGTEEKRVSFAVELEEEVSLSKEKISQKTNISKQKLEKILPDLTAKNEIIKFDLGQFDSYLHKKIYNKLTDETINILQNYHNKYSLRQGLPKEELREKISVNLEKREFDQFIDDLIEKDKIKLEKAKVSLFDFEIKYSPEELEIKNKIIDIFENNYMPPGADNVPAEFKEGDELVLEIFQAVVREEILLKIDHNLYFHRDVINKAKDSLIEYLEESGTIELSEFRDLLESSRKYALPLLEYFDKEGFLTRDGDKRRLV